MLLPGNYSRKLTVTIQIFLSKVLTVTLISVETTKKSMKKGQLKKSEQTKYLETSTISMKERHHFTWKQHAGWSTLLLCKFRASNILISLEIFDFTVSERRKK